MCEVTCENFEEKYPQIINDLRSASFISIDCEFTGLSDDDNRISLFDTPKDRFIKLQNTLRDVLIIQLGLSTFKYERDNNNFKSSSYTFYLMPTTVLTNYRFMCQAICIDFLCKQSFDFNKLFYKGISFLNKSDESKILKMIEDGRIINGGYAHEIQKYCSQITEWSFSKPQESEMLLKLKEKSTFIYLLQLEIRKRFSDIWTYSEEPGVIRVRKLKESEKKRLLLEEEGINLRKKLFESILGFSMIMKEIQNLKKPVIGHNFLLDLIMIYKQFYNPFPISYKEFKREIMIIFPKIYDTKCLSFELREILSRDNTWYANDLSNLYNYLKNGKGATLVIFPPLVNHTNEEYLKEQKFHEAGFDSYCTGFCFLRMAHIFSLWDEEKKSFHLTSMPTSISWLLGAVEFMQNRVNLTRGQVNHIALNDQDPRSIRPGFLFFRSRTNVALNMPKILEGTAKCDSVDIQHFNKYSGLIATANRKQAKEILEYFRDHKEVEVHKYNFLKHSTIGWMITSSSVMASVTVIVIGFLKGWHKGWQ